MFLRRNKSKSKKSVNASSNTSVNDYAVNPNDDYEKASNIKVVEQDLTIKNNRSGIFYLIDPISSNWIT